MHSETQSLRPKTLASFAGAGQLASFAADALTGKRIKIVTATTSSLYLRDKEIEAKLCLRLFDQITGALLQIIAYFVV
jgi:hypothetical protein